MVTDRRRKGKLQRKRNNKDREGRRERERSDWGWRKGSSRSLSRDPRLTL